MSYLTILKAKVEAESFCTAIHENRTIPLDRRILMMQKAMEEGVYMKDHEGFTLGVPVPTLEVEKRVS